VHCQQRIIETPLAQVTPGANEVGNDIYLQCRLQRLAVLSNDV
jgi:hypothetical protein